jgi:hypothetical protein
VEDDVARDSLTAVVAQVHVDGDRGTKFLLWYSWRREAHVGEVLYVEPRETSFGFNLGPDLDIKVVPNRIRLRLEKVKSLSYGTGNDVLVPSAGVIKGECDWKCGYQRSLVEGRFFGELGRHVTVIAACREDGREENRTANCQSTHDGPPVKAVEVADHVGGSAVLGSFEALGRRRGGGEDPWLCGPGFRRVCLFVCDGCAAYLRGWYRSGQERRAK